MRQKNKKGTKILLTIIALILLGLAYFGFTNSKKENVAVIKESSNNSETTSKITKSDDNQIKTQETEQIGSENQSAPVITPSTTLAKSAIMDYIDKNVGTLASAPPNAGAWKVNRYWFTNNNNVYVEYASDGELKQMLISVDTNNTDPVYTRKATFGAGESSWVLEQGEDTQFGKTKELYEKLGDQWIKKN